MIHANLKEHHVHGEWFKCDVETIRKATYEPRLILEKVKRAYSRELIAERNFYLGIRKGTENETSENINV